MIITDLDGTLLGKGSKVGSRNVETLRMLKKRGVIRVVATGRVLYSVRKVLDEDFPIDYLVFSSGTGVLDCSSGELLRSTSLEKEEIEEAVDFFRNENLNFMLHAPVPDNHYCLVGPSEDTYTEDFERRLKIYNEFATHWSESSRLLKSWDHKASIILCSCHKEKGDELFERLSQKLKNSKVVRSTSPLNNDYYWVEVIPEEATKALASKWLKNHLGYKESVMAIGNDFNDLDLLEWADDSFVVENAPLSMREKFQVVGSNEENGFSQAVDIFLERGMK